MTRAGELIYAARPRVVLRHLGQLCVALALLAVVPLVAAAAAGSWRASAAYALAGGAVLLAGLGLTRIRAPGQIQTNEAMVLVALSFLLAPLVAVPAFVLEGMAPLDALFEAVSGITTTGLTMVVDPGALAPDLVLARAWLQWFGGLGFVTLSVLLVTPGSGIAQRLGSVEPLDSDPATGARVQGRRALIVYATLTVAGTVLLLALGTDLVDALGNALAAVSTGGFSTHADNLAGLERVPARAIVMLLCLLGATPAVLLYHAAGGRLRAVARDPQVLALLVGGATVAALLLAFGAGGSGALHERAGHAVLTALSAQTTGGFSTVAPADLDPASKVAVMAAMLIGGGSGSTAGGIKLLRLLIAFQIARAMVLRTAMPRRAVFTPRIGAVAIENEDMANALAIILLFVLVIVLSWIAFLLHGYDPLDALFEVVSATGTVGLSTGITGPALEPVLKLVLCADMMLGRLEIVALLVLLAPRTWFGKRMQTS